jgi:hypothetical protein
MWPTTGSAFKPLPQPPKYVPLRKAQYVDPQNPVSSPETFESLYRKIFWNGVVDEGRDGTFDLPEIHRANVRENIAAALAANRYPIRNLDTREPTIYVVKKKK